MASEALRLLNGIVDDRESVIRNTIAATDCDMDITDIRHMPHVTDVCLIGDVCERSRLCAWLSHRIELLRKVAGVSHARYAETSITVGDAIVLVAIIRVEYTCSITLSVPGVSVTVCSNDPGTSRLRYPSLVGDGVFRERRSVVPC